MHETAASFSTTLDSTPRRAPTALPCLMRRGASLNSYGFAPALPSILPLIGAPRRAEINVAPHARRRQNYLLFRSGPLDGSPNAYEVSSEKFVNYARRSPPPKPLFFHTALPTTQPTKANSPTQRHFRNEPYVTQHYIPQEQIMPNGRTPYHDYDSQNESSQRLTPAANTILKTSTSPTVSTGAGDTVVIQEQKKHQTIADKSNRMRGVTFDGFKRNIAAASRDDAGERSGSGGGASTSRDSGEKATTTDESESNDAPTIRSRGMVGTGGMDRPAEPGEADGAGDGGVEHVLLPNHQNHRPMPLDSVGLIKERFAELDDNEPKIHAEKASLKSNLKLEDAILRLNIGGASYRIRTRSILKYGPNTLLGRFCRMDHEHRRSWADAFFEESDEYFFERVPRYFDPIYDFYAAGKLHVPKDLCFDKFMGELRFWAVSKAKMDDCCSPFAQYCLMRKLPSDQPEKDHFIGLRCAKIRRRLWLILEGHSKSKWWKLFELTSTSFVVLSITALILGSMPDFQVVEQQRSGSSQNFVSITNPTYPKAEGQTSFTKKTLKEGEDQKQEMVEHPVFNVVENMCVVYFTFEYLLRFWVAPRKFIFVKEFLNVIDLLAIAPFVFELILILVGIRGDNVRKVRWAFLTVRLLRVLRVVRIAKLGRFSPGLANFALTLRKSKKQMQMVAIVLLTVIIFFSTLMYFLERDEPNTMFTSIPAAFWWCLFSQTKWVPQTAVGKVVGGGAIICGVLVLALPIAILVNNFMQVVKLREEKVIKQYAQQYGDRV